MSVLACGQWLHFYDVWLDKALLDKAFRFDLAPDNALLLLPLTANSTTNSLYRAEIIQAIYKLHPYFKDITCNRTGNILHFIMLHELGKLFIQGFTARQCIRLPRLKLRLR